MNRTYSPFQRGLGILLLAISGLVRAGEVPYSLSADTTVLYYNSSGYFHDSASRYDYGLALDLSYPLSPYFQLTGMGIFGFQSEFQFWGAGLTYEFVPAVIARVVEGDSTIIQSYRKWRPYVQLAIGENTAESILDVPLIHTQIIENTFGIFGAAGCGYAFNSTLEINARFMFLYGMNADLTVLSSGIMVGLKYNLY